MKRTIVFDNDGTLYKVPEEFQLAVIEKMHSYLANLLGVSSETIQTLRLNLLKKHDTESTCKSFNLEYGIDSEEFEKNSFLAVDPSFFMGRDEKLIYTLENFVAKKIILTNNPSSFARGILETLGVASFFDFILGEKEIDYKHKPNLHAFLCADKFCAGDKFMVEDNAKNLVVARKMGYKTVYVGEPVDDHVFDYQIKDIYGMGVIK